MDAFTLVMTGLLLVLVLGVLALGLFAPGSGARQLDWRPTRSPELEAQNEADDLDQLVEALNVRRRARGQAELTEREVEARVAADRRALGDRRP
ncbi:MAG TPA: hypothetical protein VLA98_15245 [Solirubrobacteraceae bacterium]|nr:hypothetical protein [Solirubrobacteraceae bacterium]